MEKDSGNIRDRLLSQLPQPANLEAYREEVASTLERNEKRLRWEKWGSRVFWFYVIGIALIGYYRGETWLTTTPHGRVWATSSIILFVCGAVELLKHFINRSRVELLKEVKQVQLQVLELQASLQKRGKVE
jgi:hypothetical protein